MSRVLGSSRASRARSVPFTSFTVSASPRTFSAFDLGLVVILLPRTYALGYHPHELGFVTAGGNETGQTVEPLPLRVLDLDTET
jgi:hypothetical protein